MYRILRTLNSIAHSTPGPAACIHMGLGVMENNPNATYLLTF